MRRFLAILLLFMMVALPALGQETDSLLFSFVGDCTLGGHEGWMNYSIGTFKVMAQEQNDPSYFLRYCQDLFAKDDFTFVNLEGVLKDDGKGQNTYLKWNFRGQTDYVNILTQGSVEGATLGNNHSMDFGKQGLESTQQTLDGAGILWCYNQTAAFFEKNGRKIALLGFWEADFDKHKDWLKTEIPRLKAEEGCDMVIFNYHGGFQYFQKHSKRQTAAMHYVIDCGADLVIGHHPHVLQGFEIYKNRMIVYSLGDFCYGGNRKPREVEYPSMILSAKLLFNQDGFLGTQLTIHPYNISATKPRNNYQPYPVTGELAQEVMDIIQKDTPFPLNPFVEGLGAVQEAVLINAEPPVPLAGSAP